MEINVPDLAQQQRFIYQQSTQHAIEVLRTNLDAPYLAGQQEIDESAYCRAHLLTKAQGWSAPHEDIVGAYFRHFQHHFPEYNSDKKLAALLSVSSDRRIRDFKQGARKVPYEIWRHFLVITGRAPQEVIKVMAFMGGDKPE